MGRKISRAVQEGREAALEMSLDLAHSLACESCGLRQEALHVLSLIRWTEDEFWAAAATRLLEGLRGA